MPQRTVLSHADMVAAANKDTGPLSIGGWVPPTTFAAAPPATHARADPPEIGGSTAYGSDGSSDDGGEPQEPGSEPGPEAEETPSEAPKEGGGLVGYESSSDSDSDADAPAERDRPVSFF